MPNLKIPLPTFDALSLGAAVNCKPDIASRKLKAFYLQTIGTGSPTPEDYFEYVLVNVNDKQKILIKPGMQRHFDRLMDVNDDVYDGSFLRIPLTRPGLGLLFSRWGTADIDRMTISVKLVGSNPSGKTLTAIRGWMKFEPGIEPRGDVFLQSIYTTGVPAGGWNEISDFPLKDISHVTKAIFGHNAIRQVKISIGDRLIYDMTREAAAEDLRHNPRYAVTDAAKAIATPLLCFPAVLDDDGLPEDFWPLVESGARRPLKVEYYWDTGVTGTPVAFDIGVEGIERGAPSPVPSSRA